MSGRTCTVKSTTNDRFLRITIVLIKMSELGFESRPNKPTTRIYPLNYCVITVFVIFLYFKASYRTHSSRALFGSFCIFTFRWVVEYWKIVQTIILPGIRRNTLDSFQVPTFNTYVFECDVLCENPQFTDEEFWKSVFGNSEIVSTGVSHTSYKKHFERKIKNVSLL